MTSIICSSGGVNKLARVAGWLCKTPKYLFHMSWYREQNLLLHNWINTSLIVLGCKSDEGHDDPDPKCPKFEEQDLIFAFSFCSSTLGERTALIWDAGCFKRFTATRDEEAGLAPPRARKSRTARGGSRESRVGHYVTRTSVRAGERTGASTRLTSCLYPNCRWKSGAVNYEWNPEGSSGASPPSPSHAAMEKQLRSVPNMPFHMYSPLAHKPQLLFYHSAGISSFFFSLGIEHKSFSPSQFLFRRCSYTAENKKKKTSSSSMHGTDSHFLQLKASAYVRESWVWNCVVGLLPSRTCQTSSCNHRQIRFSIS